MKKILSCAIILSSLVSIAAESTSEVSETEKPTSKIHSSVNFSASAGSDDYTDSGVSVTIGLSSMWGSDFFASTTRLNGAVVERELGIAPFYRPDEHQELKLQLSSGGDSVTKSRTFGAEYSYDLAALWDGERRSQISLGVTSTGYTVDGIRLAPRESRVLLNFDQDLTENWSFGIGFATSSYSDLAVKSYRRDMLRNGFDVSQDVYSSGPIDREASFDLSYVFSEKNSFQIGSAHSLPVKNGGAKSGSATSGFFSWSHNWNDNVSFGLRFSGTKSNSTSNSSSSGNFTYTF